MAIEIVFIEYNGANRPFQVYTSDLVGYDFFMKNGEIQCDWCSGNIRPFMNELVESAKGKYKVWFKEEFRPTKNTMADSKTFLTDSEIENYGFVILQEPKYLKEILEAIENY